MVKLEKIEAGKRVQVKEGRYKGVESYVLYKMSFNNEWALHDEDPFTNLYNMREPELNLKLINN